MHSNTAQLTAVDQLQPMLIHGCHQDDGPGFHYQSPGLYYGITDELMWRPQSVQNAAARLITSTRRCDHISPVLRQLHWLPVWQRVNYKIVTLVHRCLSGHVPSYLADDCRLITDAGVLPTLEHWSSVAHKVVLAIEHSLWQHLGSGTDLFYGKFRRSL